MLAVTKSYKVFLLSVFILAVSACSSTPDSDDNYKGIYSSKTPKDYSLEVPPDLVEPDSSNALILPTLSERSEADLVLARSSSGVRFVREGDVFWLEIKGKPDQIWGQVRNFFKDLGFSFTIDSPVNGLLETNWLENRIDTPSGWFMSMLSKLGSTGIRDRYRIRLERSEKDDVTLMFITHQGLQEQSNSDWAGSDFSIVWEMRDSDPELEAEMLQRFLVFRGVAKVDAKQITAVKHIAERATLIEDKADKSYRIEVNEIFSRTWRRISIALDRMGLDIEDRNRSEGIYYIKTTEDFIKVNEEDKSWFASIFSSSDEAMQVAAFQLRVEEVDAKTVISIFDQSGERDKSKTGYFILKKIKDHLR